MATRKLLLADDSVTIQKVVNLTFADEGMDVTAVGDGDRAIEKIEQMMPDIVLADVHMPGLSGYEVCEHIKQHPRFGHIPVILLVGSFEPFDEEEAKRVGANDYLTKPFQSIRQLVSRVNALLPEQSLEEEEVVTGDLVQPVTETESDETVQSTTPAFTETWEPAPSQSFSDSVIDDELLEATPVSDSGNVAAKQPTFSSAPRETTRLSAEEISAFDINIPSASSTPMEIENNEVDSATPTSSYKDYVETTSDYVETTSDYEEEIEIEIETSPTQEVEHSVEDEPDILATPSPYSTTPLSEDTLLELGSAETVAMEVDDDDSILDLGDDLYASPVVKPSQAAYAVGNTSSANIEAMAEQTATNEIQNGEEVDMPSSIETVSTTPVIETITASSPVSVSASGGSLSPEAIEAIARRVVEMMSDKTVREIAWEVVPELADLHIKHKMQEKNL